MTQDQQHPPQEPLADACSAALHPQALEGLELFNAGEYFEAHEALENAWRDEKGPIRDLYRGILQVGVGYHHILGGNYTGAVKMFQRCRQWLDPFPDFCCGIDLRTFRQDFERVEQVLLKLGPGQINSIDRSLFKPIQYQV